MRIMNVGQRHDIVPWLVTYPKAALEDIVQVE